MYTHTERLGSSRHRVDIPHDSRAVELAIDKERWIQRYAVRILNRYLHWQTPLEVATACASRLRNDLAALYDDPMKRMFIEASY
jgi:hypothetical protein